MSIAVRVTQVIIHQNGGGELHLKDRPAPGARPGPRAAGSLVGQQVLFFDKAPPDVYALEGKDLQLGTQPSEDITLDGRKIAERAGYAGIEFVVDRIEEG